MKATPLWGAQAAPHARPGVHYLIALAYLCTTGGPLRIDKVVPRHPTGNLTVVDWGTRRRYAGDPYGTYALPFTGPVDQTPGFGRNPIGVRCGGTAGTYDELTIGVTFGSARATMSGAWVYYRSAADTRKVFVSYQAAYCTGPADCPGLTKDESG